MKHPAQLTDEERARVRAGCAAADEHFDSYAERCADAATEKALRWVRERLKGAGARVVRDLVSLGADDLDEELVREVVEDVMAAAVQTAPAVAALPNQQTLDRAVEHLRTMGPEEFRQSLVRAGTHTADGKLVPELQEKTIPFKTTPEQALALASIMVEMKNAGLDHEFIVKASELGRMDQGVYDLMALWLNSARDPAERDEIIADLHESIDDYAESPKETHHNP